LSIRIDIRVPDAKAIYLTLKADVENGAYFERETGISGRALPFPVRDALPAGPEVFSFVLEFSTAVAASWIANWLYDRLGGKGATVVIGKKEIRIENAEKLKETVIEAILKAGTKK
jgi:hypothetical protein